MNILFVAGPGRSGTTAFANYLNQHPRILVCRERYKFVQQQITPEFFTFERILDYREGETNTPYESHQNLLSEKDEGELAWIGDKTPSYVRNLGRLHKNNPGAKFVVLYRPIEEVAESYEARSRNPEDKWLGGKDGFEIGVRDWNVAMRKTRQFAEGPRQPEVLVVSYHDFFSQGETFVPLISRFLEVEFDQEVGKSWARMSRSFEGKRRDKSPLSEEQARYIQENKDYEAEQWMLERIQRQWETLAESGRKQVSPPNKRRANEIQQLKRRVLELEQGLEREQRTTQYIEARLRGLESQSRSSKKGSRISRFLEDLRSRLPGGRS